MAASILVPGSNFPTPALVADPVLSYPATPGFPASGPGGVATFTTATVGGAQVPVSAAFEIQSTKGAFIMPRMSAAQRTALIATNGMQVYELDTQAVWWYLNGTWTQVDPTGGGGGDISGPGASTLNAIVSWNNTLGTTVKDNKALITVSGTDANASDLTLIATIQASKTAGLIGSPNYSFTGDTNTGMWSSAAETLDFSTSGARQFQIINTATTTSWLAITGSAGAPNGVPSIQAVSGGGGPANVEVLIKPFGTTGALVVAGGTNLVGGTIALLNAAGTAAATLSVAAGLGASVSWILPTADATLANQPLVSDAAGNLSFYGTALSGFVVGPVSATDKHLARFNLATGKLIQDSAVLVADTTGTITLAANGQFIADVGSATNPSFTFLGDTNTGIYRTSAEHIGFAGNGALQFEIAGVAAANNYLVYSASNGSDPRFTATGASAKIDIDLLTKGANGQVSIYSATGATPGVLGIWNSTSTNFTGLTAPALASGVTFVLPATDGTAGQVLVTDGAANLSFASPAATIQIASGTILNAAAQTAYTTPIQLVPAAGPSTVIIIDRVSIEFVGATPFAGGGNIVIEYGNGAHGVGPLASGNIAFGSFSGLAASTILFSNPTIADVVVSTGVNAGIFLSATTSDFTGGGDLVYSVQYSVMTVS